MLEGTQVRLRIASPNINNPIARTAVEMIDNTGIEFDDSSFFDLSGDPYDVVAAQFDIAGSQVRYGILDYGGRFADVDDRTGFNGWALTFLELQGNSSARIANVEILAGRNTLEVPASFVSFSRDTVFVNVDNLSFSRGEELVLQLGYRVDGGRTADLLEGDMGRDILNGNGGNDFLFGAAGNDVLSGGAGNDQMFGGTGHDRLVGALGNDLLFGGMGNDVLNGGAGHDRLDGGARNDQLLGAAGNDVMNGAIGNDRLNGGLGNDVLTGGQGADVFVFQNRGGRDVVRDFDADLGGERIDLRAVTSIIGFGDLRANHLSSLNGSAVIDLGGPHKVILQGVAVAELAADDFLF